MNLIEFGQAMEKVERHFGSIEDEQKRQDYFDFFRHLSVNFFKKIVDEVIKKHKGKWFPVPAEFEEAQEELEKYRSYADAEDLQRQEKFVCPKCQNDGRYIEERLYLGVIGPVAVFCNCERGERMRRGYERHLKRKTRRPQAQTEGGMPF